MLVPSCCMQCSFTENLFVVSPEFNLKFYTMAPLLSSFNGHRIGTL